MSGSDGASSGVEPVRARPAWPSGGTDVDGELADLLSLDRPPEDASARAEEAALRDKVGWAYERLPWLTESEASTARDARRRLLGGLCGVASFNVHTGTVHRGPLPPGCRACGAGLGRGVNMWTSCTRKCFFCFQPEAPADGRFYGVGGSRGPRVRSALAVVRHLEAAGACGAGITGPGDPLCDPPKLLELLCLLRERLGASCHLWLYTNGDRLSEGLLRELRARGLDEIRIDVAASGYDLVPVLLAKRFIPTTVIETPTIPEDAGRLRRLLEDAADHGVEYVNLHPLDVVAENYAKLARRPYRFVRGENLAGRVLEAELAALELMSTLASTRPRLATNYCFGLSTRGGDHESSWRQALARLARRPHQEITDAGYLRSVRLVGGTATLQALVARGVRGSQDMRIEGTRAYAATAILDGVDWREVEATLVYDAPAFRFVDEAPEYFHREVLRVRLDEADFTSWSTHFGPTRTDEGGGLPPRLVALRPFERQTVALPPIL